MSLQIMVFYQVFYNPALYETLEPIKLKLMFYQHGVITSVVFIYLYFVVQFVYYELCYKYYSFLNQSNKLINNYIAFNPNFLIRYQIDKVINDFDENRQKWSKTVIPLKRIICVSFILSNFVLIFLYQCNLEYNVNTNTNNVLFIFIFVLNFYTIVTQVVIFKMSMIENILINTLTLWRNNHNPNNPLLLVIVNN